MKVSMYIKNNGCSFRYHLDAEFPCAPRVGEFVSVDWDPVKEAIINNDDLFDYCEFLPRDLAEWYINPRKQETGTKTNEGSIMGGIML